MNETIIKLNRMADYIEERAPARAEFYRRIAAHMRGQATPRFPRFFPNAGRWTGYS